MSIAYASRSMSATIHVKDERDVYSIWKRLAERANNFHMAPEFSSVWSAKDRSFIVSLRFSPNDLHVLRDCLQQTFQPDSSPTSVGIDELRSEAKRLVESHRQRSPVQFALWIDPAPSSAIHLLEIQDDLSDNGENTFFALGFSALAGLQRLLVETVYVSAMPFSQLTRLLSLPVETFHQPMDRRFHEALISKRYEILYGDAVQFEAAVRKVGES